MDRREAAVDRSFQILNSFTASYGGDGGCDEGPSYWGAAGASLFDSLEILYDMTGGKLDLFRQPLVRAMGEYIEKVYIHHNYFINFADCHGQVDVDNVMIARYGRRADSKGLENFALSRIDPGRLPKGCYHVYRALKNLWDRPVQTVSVRYAPGAFVYLPDIQVVAMREEPKSDAGLYVAVKGGHNGESHNHNDVGNCIVYYNGKPVILDAGVDTYTEKTFSPQRYTIWSMGSAYHTLPTVNGAEQKDGEAYGARAFEASQDRMTVSLDIAGAYPKEAGLRRWIRQVKLCKGMIWIAETVEPETAAQLELHYLLLDRPELTAPGRAELTGDLTFRYPDTLSPEIEAIDVRGTRISEPWNRDTLYRLVLRGRIEGDAVLSFQIQKKTTE